MVFVRKTELMTLMKKRRNVSSRCRIPCRTQTNASKLCAQLHLRDAFGGEAISKNAFEGFENEVIKDLKIDSYLLTKICTVFNPVFAPPIHLDHYMLDVR